jgi:uncharacterized protein (DUF486 family)
MISGTLKNQGITILLNQFFNPIIAASRMLAVSVGTVVGNFAENFSAAIKAQITKYYAAGQIKEMLSLIGNGVKGAWFLMYYLSSPLNWKYRWFFLCG